MDLNINKKLISSLIGGGVILATSFGGIKLKNKLDYSSKMNHYEKLNSHFSENAPGHIKSGWYIPKWNDHEGWKKVHQREKGIIPGLRGAYTTYEKMRETCYELITKDKKFDNCWGASETWCTACARSK
ncbi:hypothetical protein A6V39_05725 [Candidatus Mycoplasma haematobovis]|uniref:Uncharacterized protein n=1 Tax=Candidatus Mycoplasma haematobovis TaxID=432608 RepID=A0A1A9QFT2_9MOLU|nr:hypothetical protein [Candidatus Mycoplasma haematobovis]OAL10806.1 hypothetical protein A6V39_05725 [Candidatus Mycoplasma haematobovis]